MKVKWLPDARIQFQKIVKFGVEKFGQNTVLRFQRKVRLQANMLGNYPEIGKREPLLMEHVKEYRCLVIKPHFKLIYHIDKQKDVVYIADFWDTQRNPTTLASRLS